MASRALILLVLALAASPALAQSQKPAASAHRQQAPAADPVVARVNGTPIYRSDLEALRATLPPQAQQEPEDQLYPQLVNQRIALELVSQAAAKERLANDPRVKKMELLADEQILQNAYFDPIVRGQVTDAKLHAAYDQYLKAHPPQNEVRARHILVPTEQEAKEIIAQLKKGADFATLADEKTTDPAGKASGGELGYFTQSDMVPEFAKAAFALKPGQFTETPVHTQFGWHVIEVEDRRQGKAPSFDDVKQQLAQQTMEQVYDQRVKQLADASKIEVFNEDGSKVQPAPLPPGAQAAPPAAAATPVADQPPQLLPLDNGTPSAPPPDAGPPTLAPATEGIGK